MSVRSDKECVSLAWSHSGLSCGDMDCGAKRDGESQPFTLAYLGHGKTVDLAECHTQPRLRILDSPAYFIDRQLRVAQ